MSGFGGTWTCHVCGDERPDERISVRSVSEPLLAGITVTVNVRYCNDREECRERAADKVGDWLGPFAGEDKAKL